MGNKLKLAIIGLLGFSTACTTVRKAEMPAEPQDAPHGEESYPAIRVMYGVRSAFPVAVSEEERRAEQAPTASADDDTPADKR